MNDGALVLPAIGGLFAIAGGLFLIWAERYARRPAKEEHGLTPSYIERGGARFDMWNWTAPFVRVATFEDFVAISSITHEIVLRRGDVTRIAEEKRWGSRGVRVEHTRADAPSIILWSRSPARLQAALNDSLLERQPHDASSPLAPAAGDARQDSVAQRVPLLAVATMHWRSFALAWLFPVVFLYGGLASESMKREQSFFLFIAAPLFFWGFFRATRPLRRGELDYWPCVFWAMVVPFLIWVGAVFSRLLVLAALRGTLGAV